MDITGRKRVVIEGVEPEINGGRYPIKRVVGEKVTVCADVFAEGHDAVVAILEYRREVEGSWSEVSMRHLGNDRWEGFFLPLKLGEYRYRVRGYVDSFRTWVEGLIKKHGAGQDLSIELLIGAALVEEAMGRAGREEKRKLSELSSLLKEGEKLESIFQHVRSEHVLSLMRTYRPRHHEALYGKELTVVVEREKAGFSTWYELFPRSAAGEAAKHGSFKDCEAILPDIARFGFDVIYFPPIHPIGRSRRKGKNNVLVAGEGDPGSPWAIGSSEGGHKAIHPDLGTMDDFASLVSKAKKLGVEVAMDIAFQCSPDHPYVREHPEWFRWRPDGSVQYAENPPKKYEDIIPFDFETDNWRELWEELKSVVLFWVDRGITLFRVDNPHTKPFPFWEWLISEVRREQPEVLFLSEAFTRPKVMYRLAKIGFSMSYTYFTWRNTKRELIEYMTEITRSPVAEYFRPHFWPNTPDILPEYLQYGGRPAFVIRLVLAATLSSHYGIYGPAYELCVGDAVSGKEEYVDSEKYEIKKWDLKKPGNLRDFISRVNRIRRENPALQSTRNIDFFEVDNDNLLFYGKYTDDISNLILVVVNLDPFHTQSGIIKVPLKEFGIDPGSSFLVHDLLSNDRFIWHSEDNHVTLDPQVAPAYIFHIRRRLKREHDFDYFM